MHNAAFEAVGLNCRYLPFVVQEKDLRAAVEGIRALNLIGINVTMPHKETVISYLDELSDDSKRIGAVNTIKNLDGKLKGFNTDTCGFLDALEEQGFSSAGKNAIILGAGGAAKAVAVALAGSGSSNIAIIARDAAKAGDLKARLTAHFAETSVKTLTFDDDLADIFEKGNLVVNATPIGMEESAGTAPIPLDLINESHFVYDLIYTPLETALVKGAKERGARAAGGLGMLLYQAVRAFAIWTGQTPPVEVMRAALLDELERKDRPNNAKEKDR
jgi:shikimate dehydrogenase